MEVFQDLDDMCHVSIGEDPVYQHRNAKWAARVLAFSSLAKEMIGLPVDFQIQKCSRANWKYGGRRSARGIKPGGGEFQASSKLQQPRGSGSSAREWEPAESPRFPYWLNPGSGCPATGRCNPERECLCR